MDMYFYHRTITDVNLYNCSSLSEDELFAIKAVRKPIQGVCAFAFGIAMMIIYTLCLRVMLMPQLFIKSCYKIMFLLGIYDTMGLIGINLLQSNIQTFGVSFCDLPNLFYFLGCLQMIYWSGSSFFCLYLSFNRMLEILKFRRAIINFFFSPSRSVLGCLLGILYSLYHFFFTTPMIFSSIDSTIVPDPLRIMQKVEFEFRMNALVFNNDCLVVITFTLYGVFCFLFYKKMNRFLTVSTTRGNLQYQVFIQATLVCAIMVIYGLGYSFYLFFPSFTLLPKILFISYQYTIGFQALIYLLCNQTIRDNVRDLVFGLVRAKSVSVTTVDFATRNKNEGIVDQNNISINSIHSARFQRSES